MSVASISRAPLTARFGPISVITPSFMATARKHIALRNRSSWSRKDGQKVQVGRLTVAGEGGSQGAIDDGAVADDDVGHVETSLRLEALARIRRSARSRLESRVGWTQDGSLPR